MTGRRTNAEDGDTNDEDANDRDASGGNADDGDEATEPESASNVDGVFGLAVGLYAAALVAPAVAVGVALEATADPGVLFFALLGSAVVVTGGVGWVAARESLAVRLGGSRWVWTAMGTPVLYFAAVFGSGLVRENPASAVVNLAFVGALASLVAGTALAVAARNRHASAVLADAEEFVRFSASPPERDRWIATRAAALAIVASIVGIVVADGPLVRGVFQFLGPLGGGLFGMTNEREVVVTDRGLVVSTPVSKQLRPWTAYESYEVTDEVVVVRRAGWSAWGLLDVRRDASEVEDPEAVADALGEFLPRR